MNPALIPSIGLIIALLTLVLKWGSSNNSIKILKKKVEELELTNLENDKLVSNDLKEIEKLKIEIGLFQKNIAEVTKDNETLKAKYSGILQVEDIIELKKSEFRASLDSLNELNEKYVKAYELYKNLENEIILFQSDLSITQFGLYKPQYDYFTSEEFKQKIEHNYLKQRELIKIDRACVAHKEWALDGSKIEGKKLTTLYKRLMLFAFNGECDALIAKLRWNTATKTIERLNKSFEAINKLGTVADVEITREFLDLKLAELALTHEYENKKQDEKEEQRRIREQMREEEKVQRDIDRAQKEAEEDERRYQKALLRVKEDLRYASKDELDELNIKLSELQQKLKEAVEKKQRALSMAQQTKAGHIYVISNVGSFGEDIYKIGMTRRLEPLDRVRELSDAAVPFRYDVHAIIYSDDAPRLEYDLHKRFNDKRINKVNGRKEFFKVTLLEIESFVKEHANAEIEFTQLAEAREYRETVLMIEALLRDNMEITAIEKEQKFPSTLL